ncbi:hypothetical protein P4110_11225 [Pseudomonas aeruginosa]|nr:hypothetical protein [Pseudomonas aeruginosa]
MFLTGNHLVEMLSPMRHRACAGFGALMSPRLSANLLKREMQATPR